MFKLPFKRKPSLPPTDMTYDRFMSICAQYLKDYESQDEIEPLWERLGWSEEEYYRREKMKAFGLTH